MLWHVTGVTRPQRVAQVGAGKRVRETPRTAKIVLCTGAADGRILPITIDIELHLALTPPAVRHLRPAERRAHVVPAPMHTVQDDMLRPLAGSLRPPPLGVEVSGTLGHIRKGVVNLIEESPEL